MLNWKCKAVSLSAYETRHIERHQVSFNSFEIEKSYLIIYQYELIAFHFLLNVLVS